MHYYQFNIGDYAKDTRHLSLMEDLAYRRMIDLYYDTEKPLVKCTTRLARLIYMIGHEDVVQTVLEDFFIYDGDAHRHERIEEDIAEYHAKAKSARANGKKGGRPKKVKQDAPDNPEVSENNPEVSENNPEVSENNPEVSEAKAKLTQPKANQELRTINHKPITNNQELDHKDLSSKHDVTDIFEHWRMVMGKGGQTILTKERSKKIKDRLSEGYTVEQIKTAIEGCAMTPHNMGQNDNGKRYDDIGLICRTGSHLERFSGNAETAKPRAMSATTERTINNIMDVELD